MLSLPHPALQFVLAAIAFIAAITDLRTRTIPNWLTGGGMIAGAAVQIAVAGWAGAKAAALGLGLAMLIYLPLYLLRGMGGGDVKLMAALGAAAGPQNWLAIFLITSLVGGIAAVIVILASGSVGRTLRNLATILGSLLRLRAPHEAEPELDVAHPSSRGLPHGAVIAGGVALFLLLARV